MIISYKINKSVKPCDVISALEGLMDKHSCICGDHLLSVGVHICEYEYEGKWHTNRAKNAVNSIIKHYPPLEAFFEKEPILQQQQGVCEAFYIRNFSSDDLHSNGKIEYNVIQSIALGVPKPYSLNELDITYCGIRFGGASEGGADAYIRYTRSSFGSEKHSYIYYFATDADIDNIRSIFFDFAKIIPGKYIETSI